jgi:hypothetical protein
METGNDGHDYGTFYRAGKVRRGGRGGETIAAAKLVKVFDAPITESEKHVGGEETRGGGTAGRGRGGDAGGEPSRRVAAAAGKWWWRTDKWRCGDGWRWLMTGVLGRGGPKGRVAAGPTSLRKEK